MTFKLKVLFLATALGLSSALLVTTSVLYQRKAQEIADLKNESVNPLEPNNTFNLQEFNFETNSLKIDKSVRYARDFASANLFKENLNIKSDKFWYEQLLLSQVDKSDKLFFLNSKNNTPLNVFTNQYIIDLKSYANDVLGQLYLDVKLSPKPEFFKLSSQHFTYVIEGFKQLKNSDDLSNAVSLSSVFLKEALSSKKTYQEIFDEFTKANAKEKLAWINKWISLEVDKGALIDPESLELVLNPVASNPKSIKVKYSLLIKSYAASTDDLLKIENLKSTLKNKKELEIPLSFIELHKLNATLKLQPKNSKNFNEFSFSDLRFDRSTNSIANLEIASSDTTFKADNYIITLNDFRAADTDKDNYLVPYTILLKDDYNKGFSYVISSNFKIAKSSLKK
ncbi:MAG1430 family protein [Mycoplasmopsis alligatoris]|uniref:Uncharacterized protein n=1 Tax=Mycoplasmopsis alligatoris A21JP2 TaxID=747682 RepID=D4XV70_9BACT|nr:hypothetical protein [Mycoplasmopsis alligatoris]EFF41785.1 hypothetical protein MALL_0769 [Mycoplasmopsis alligatoris A21JP2]